ITIATVYGNLGIYDRAETMIEGALRLYPELRKSEEKEANARSILAAIYSSQGKMAQCQEEAHKALAIIVKLKGEENMEVVHLQTILARARNPAEAESILRKALATGRRLVGNQSGLLQETKLILAEAVDANGNSAEAEGLARDCLSGAQKQ